MGPSLSGKSFVIRRIMANVCVGFTPILISKQTNRELRREEKDATERGEQIDVKPVLQFTADLMYQTYGKRTGTTISELIDKTNDGKTPVVIINDIMAMSKLKRECESRDPDICVISIFLFRRIPVRNDFFEESRKRGNVPDEETEQRYDKAKTLYRIYIENMHVFDYVILNAITYPEEVIEDDGKIRNSIIDNQIKAIRDNIILKGIRPFKRNNHYKPPLYVITGNAASGKDELIRATIDLGKLYAEAVPKYTSRSQGSDDGPEMICKYIIDEQEVLNFKKKLSCLNKK
jgi:guanylate kinase